MDKACQRCGETKPLEGFHRRMRSRDGRQAYCKPCQITAVKTHYALHHDEVCARHSARERQMRVDSKPYAPSLYDAIRLPALVTMFAFLDFPVA